LLPFTLRTLIRPRSAFAGRLIRRHPSTYHLTLLHPRGIDNRSHGGWGFESN
jgi:hypothetical protein